MKANVQKALSVVVAAIGLALLVMVVEGEPGAIPLALILAGVVGYASGRRRGRSGNPQ